jgi:hypothetical protein
MRKPALLFVLAGCVPSHAASVSIPVVALDQRAHEDAVLRVPLRELRARLPGAQPGAVAFYAEGRAPLPCRWLDTDGDGAPDAAEVALAVRADGSTRLLAVCPGAPGPGLAAGGAPAGAVELRWDGARR